MEVSVSVRPRVCCSRYFGNGKPSWRLQLCAHSASHHHLSPHRKYSYFLGFLPYMPGTMFLGRTELVHESTANNASSTPHPDQFRRATYETCG